MDNIKIHTVAIRSILTWTEKAIEKEEYTEVIDDLISVLDEAQKAIRLAYAARNKHQETDIVEETFSRC